MYRERWGRASGGQSEAEDEPVIQSLDVAGHREIRFRSFDAVARRSDRRWRRSADPQLLVAPQDTLPVRRS
jgi:hypothetical protein